MATTIVTIPTVAIEVNTDMSVHSAEAYEMRPRAAQTTQSSTQDYGTVEGEVRSYFKDIPIMAEVARCESHFQHTNPSTGTVIRGRVNPRDVGVMQINEYYHESTAQRMGLELTDFEDNLAYARYLYEQQGTQPWSASRPCWGNQHLAMR